jgi:hypothetical protein
VSCTALLSGARIFVSMPKRNKKRGNAASGQLPKKRSVREPTAVGVISLRRGGAHRSGDSRAVYGVKGAFRGKKPEKPNTDPKPFWMRGPVMIESKILGPGFKPQALPRPPGTKR